MLPKQLAEKLVDVAHSNKAEDVIVIDLEGQSSISDYVMICQGRSQVHVRGIAERIDEELKKSNVRSRGIEGRNDANWVLMDYQDVIVHIFHPEARQYYSLEQLYSDYPRLAIPESA